MSTPAQRMYKGNAAATKLANSINATDTTFSVTTGSGTSYPDGSTGNFFVTVDRGLTGEEKILCSARSGDTFTVAVSGRGADDTTASAHAANATLEHTFTKTDAAEANAHTSATGGVHGLGGNVVGDSDTQTLSNKTLVTPTIASLTNAQHTHTTAAGGGALTFSALAGSAELASWVAYTPTWTTTGSAPSLGNGSLTGRSLKVGKTLHLSVVLSIGSTTTVGTGNWTFSLPAATATVAGQTQIVSLFGQNANVSSALRVWGHATFNGGATTTTAMWVYTPANTLLDHLSNVAPGTSWAAGDFIVLQGVMEVQ